MKPTQSQIAKEIGMTPAYLSMVINGKVPGGIGKKTAKQIGRYLDRPWKDFIDMEPDEIRAAIFRGDG